MDRDPTSVFSDIHAYLKVHEEKGLLRFITCGSVDDGKSTLIGRLLWDSKLIFEDQLAALENDSKKVKVQDSDINFALLLDGLQAEREQGITIDVAYRFFSTEKRKFIVADTPGHEQYTRNMATGASTADLAVILIDARKGIVTQTRRHSYIVSLLGIKTVILAVNKMDLVGYSQPVFNAIKDDYEAFAKSLGVEQIICVPVSALKGDNVIGPSRQTPWYDGRPLLSYLETIDTVEDAGDRPFRMPVQRISRPNADFRGFVGTIASGTIHPGDAVVVPRSGQRASIDRIVTFEGDLPVATAGQTVTLTLDKEIDISRGDVLADPNDRPVHADQFEAKLIWMYEDPLLPNRDYILRMGTAECPAHVTRLKYRIDVNTQEHIAVKTLALNEIGVCSVALGRPLSFDPYAENRLTGSFILIDRTSNATVGAGMIDFALRRATNVHWQSLDIDKVARSRQKGQKSAVLWFTGLSGSGKSAIANVLEKKLHARGKHTYTLDGDNVRHGLNKDLGFTDADRVENIRRTAEVAKLFVDAGIIVLASFISPFRSERRMAREMMEPGEFVEIFVDTPLTVCESRDVKGLYRKARAGEIPNFTGIGSPYERPEGAEIIVSGDQRDAEYQADRILERLERMGMFLEG